MASGKPRPPRATKPSGKPLEAKAAEREEVKRKAREAKAAEREEFKRARHEASEVITAAVCEEGEHGRSECQANAEAPEDYTRWLAGIANALYGAPSVPGLRTRVCPPSIP